MRLCLSDILMSNISIIKQCYNDSSHVTRITKYFTPVWYRHPKIMGVWLCHACNTSISHKGRIHTAATRLKFSLSHKGKIPSEETKKKRSLAMMGRKLSEETKRKIGDKHRGVKETPETCLKNSQARKGKTAWNKGKKMPIEFILKSAKTQFKEGSVPWNKGKTHSEYTKAIIREKRLLQVVPSRHTFPELILQSKLQELGIEFDTHIPIYGQPDIFIQPNICIFVDGDYFHGNPKKYKADHILQNGKPASWKWNYDKEVTETLEEMGMRVIRLWESDIINNLEDCIKVIKS